MTDRHRIETLELKCMDLENTVSALNDQLIRQYRDIERFAREFERLEARIDSQQNTTAASGDGHEVPPHY